MRWPRKHKERVPKIEAGNETNEQAKERNPLDNLGGGPLWDIQIADSNKKPASEGAKARLQVELTHALVTALNRHRDSLDKAGEASSKYAGRLVWATWALVAATVALFAQPFIVAWLRG